MLKTAFVLKSTDLGCPVGIHLMRQNYCKLGIPFCSRFLEQNQHNHSEYLYQEIYEIKECSKLLKNRLWVFPSFLFEIYTFRRFFVNPILFLRKNCWRVTTRKSQKKSHFGFAAAHNNNNNNNDRNNKNNNNRNTNTQVQASKMYFTQICQYWPSLWEPVSSVCFNWFFLKLNWI